MNVELIKDNDGKEIVNITLTEAEQADLFHPVPDEFVKGGKYSWKLFKKRIKEFPFIKKQPRFKKYFYTQKRITLDGKEEKIKYETSYSLYRKNKDEYMKRCVFEDWSISNGAKLLSAYWTCAKYIYHPDALKLSKKSHSNRYQTDLFNYYSYSPLVFEPASLAKHVRRKEVDTYHATMVECVFCEVIYKIMKYCLGLTNEKPDLTGYVIRK